jgi:uncharacterized protein YndB with AHSA1/START domain
LAEELTSEMSFYTVTQSIEIEAVLDTVWMAITDPSLGPLWRNAEFITTWSPGSAIDIEAHVGDRLYSDKGRVLRADAPTLLQYTYWSSISGLDDIPASYSTISMRLAPLGRNTSVMIEQLVPPSPERVGQAWQIGPESGWKHVEFYWRMALPELKRVAERGSAPTA